MAKALLKPILTELVPMVPNNILKSFFHNSPAANGKIKFILQGIDLSKKTLKPLPLPKTGGRGPDGRIWNHRCGGGAKQRYRQVDFVRTAEKNGPAVLERVMSVLYDPCRTADIAVVAGQEQKRYIIATENMKPGDIIKTSTEIPLVPIQAKEGDAHPLGALPLGTVVHNVEMYPGEGGKYARAAGTCAIILRKVQDTCILKLPSKRELVVSKLCMATVGRVSNVDHNKEHIGSPSRARWFGIRPKSGLWHRKTGYAGRKIREKKVCIVGKKKAPEPATYKFTL
ncbi:hypothetical protein ACJMK2_016039 [Sinanodonta woodiana]|uniref:Ribosomal protein L2 n=1 Tax=Sinanodonta woodiana TaxID=1069815 RepID=A0ABD3UVF7_SINWO